jgi:hypothetical protein
MPKAHILGIVCLSAFGIAQSYRLRLLRAGPGRLRHTFPRLAVVRCVERSEPHTIRGTLGSIVERLKLAFMARAAAQKLCHHPRDLTLGIAAWITLQHNLLTGVGHGKIGLGSNNHGKVWELRRNGHFALVAFQLKLCQIIDRITYRLSCAGDTDIDIDDPRLSLGLVLRKSQCVAPE